MSAHNSLIDPVIQTVVLQKELLQLIRMKGPEQKILNITLRWRG